MRFFISILLTGIGLCLSPLSLSAAEPAPLNSAATADAVEEALQAGIRALYNLDYDGARRNFQLVADKAPDRVIGLYALTTATWWELTNEFDEKNNPTLEKEFIESVDRTAALAKRKIASGDPDGEARLCLGGSLGLKSRWEAIQGHWFKAYRNGKAAYNLQADAIKINPKLYDAYLGVGIFHYYTASLPKVVKLLARLMIAKGDKELGLKQIHLAKENGNFSRMAARLFLVGINMNHEKNYPAALAPRHEYPASSFFQFLELMVLDAAKDWASLRAEAQDYLVRIERGEPSYRKHYAHRAHFLSGNSFLWEGKPQEAIQAYDKILAQFRFEDRWITWTYLNRGKAYDLLGQREKALADYKTVLEKRNVWELHDRAQELIDEPYRQAQQSK
jgi:tetratricopeptide (TPR) repeat protein